jgi:hypothetical protein
MVLVSVLRWLTHYERIRMELISKVTPPHSILYDIQTRDHIIEALEQHHSLSA